MCFLFLGRVQECFCFGFSVFAWRESEREVEGSVKSERIRPSGSEGILEVLWFLGVCV